jgi:hypothetical protein
MAAAGKRAARGARAAGGSARSRSAEPACGALLRLPGRARDSDPARCARQRASPGWGRAGAEPVGPAGSRRTGSNRAGLGGPAAARRHSSRVVNRAGRPAAGPGRRPRGLIPHQPGAGIPSEARVAGQSVTTRPTRSRTPRSDADQRGGVGWTRMEALCRARVLSHRGGAGAAGRPVCAPVRPCPPCGRTPARVRGEHEAKNG